MIARWLGRFLCAALVFSALAFVNAGGAEPIVIEKSKAPNGRFQIEVRPLTDDPSGNNIRIEIHSILDSSRIFGVFDQYQYDVVTPTSEKVMWKPDSEAFAVVLSENKGGADTLVFVRDGSNWIDLTQNLYAVGDELRAGYSAKDGWKNRSHHEFFALAWRPGDILEMSWWEDFYRWNKKGTVDAASPQKIFFKLQRAPKGPYFEQVKK